MSKLPIVAIVGRPNVGKSTLFNRLVGARQAVVSEEAGTTRDPVRNTLSWQRRDFWLVDTAGFDSPNGDLAADIQAQIEQTRLDADVIVMVIDGSAIITDFDRKCAKLALKTTKPVVLAVNKVDVFKKMSEETKKLGIKERVAVSAIHGTGSGDLLDALVKHLPKKNAKLQTPHVSIALLGRPNVGKSSLFNAMLGKKQALVSPRSGTTRDVNAATLSHSGNIYQVFDTAGIIRPGKRKGMERFSILRTLKAINQCDIGVVILDASNLAVALDKKIAGLVREAGKGLIIAVNKWDLIGDKMGGRTNIETRLQSELAFVWWAPLILTSATEDHHITKLVDMAVIVNKTAQTRLPTPMLNRVMRKAVAKHLPAGLKSYRPQPRYITQTGVSPPKFVLFGKDVEFLHESYKHYLENQLRENFDLTGTPVQLIFKSKNQS